nr:MAG TPA: hypothetical protein [Caudoviricetes sp.]
MAINTWVPLLVRTILHAILTIATIQIKVL